MYVSNKNRPDISSEVSVLATFTSRPTVYLMKAAKRVAVYLRGTAEFALTVQRGIIEIQRVDSDENVSDMLTKPLCREILLKHRKKLGLLPLR